MRKYIALLMLMMMLLISVGCSDEATIKELETQTSNAETNKMQDKQEQSKEEATAGTTEEQTSETTKGETPVSRLERLKQAFKDAGFEVGDNEMVAYEMLYANNGMKFTVDGELIEIYEYDLNNLSNEAKDMIEQAKNGSVNLSGFNIPVKYKDGLMLVRYDEHSKGDKIVEVFNNFK